MAVPAAPRTWGIFSDTGKKLLDPDSISSLKDDEKSKVSEFPVEEGGFVSYNKVQESYDVKVSMTKGGTVKEQEDFISTVRILKNRVTKLVNIVTPEDVFLSATFQSFSYSREKDKGQHLIHVLCDFKEVRQVSPQFGTVRLLPTKVKSKTDSSAKGPKHVQPKESEFAKKERETANSLVRPGLQRPAPGVS